MSCRSHTPGNRPTTFSWSEHRRYRTGDEDTYKDCNELGKDLITCHRKVCLYVVVPPTVVLVACILFGVAVGFGLGFGTNRGGSSSTTERVRDPSILSLSPGVTRDVSFGNAFFCNEVTMEVNGSTRASVYLITDTPPLTHRNSFIRNISERFIFLHTVRTWGHRISTGTNYNVTISLYIPSPYSSGVFSVFKGLSNLRSNQSLTSFFIRCTSGYTRQITFQLQDEDDYYIVYNRSQSIATSCGSGFYSQFHLNISSSWFVHPTAGLTNAPNCSATHRRQCSLHVPADSNYHALIVTDLPDYNHAALLADISIRLQCSSTRGWAYAVVVLVPLLLVVGVTITTVLCCCCWRRKRRASRHTQTTTTEEAAPTSGVQLQEMDPQGSQQAVIDQKDNKTTSDSQKDEQQHHVLTAAPPPSYNDSLDYPAQKPVLPPPYSKE